MRLRFRGIALGLLGVITLLSGTGSRAADESVAHGAASAPESSPIEQLNRMQPKAVSVSDTVTLLSLIHI